jgi:hypothetical protein
LPLAFKQSFQATMRGWTPQHGVLLAGITHRNNGWGASIAWSISLAANRLHALTAPTSSCMAFTVARYGLRVAPMTARLCS